MDNREKTVGCPHRKDARVVYLVNDGMSPPVFLVEGLAGPTIISLTNQIIRCSCLVCFETIRSRATGFPEHSPRPLVRPRPT